MRNQSSASVGRRGATVVETAFVLIICLIFMFAIYDYGRYLMLSQLANNAAREGARFAVANTSSATQANIQNTVMQYFAGEQLLNSSGKPLKATDILVYQANSTTGAAATPDSVWSDAAFGSSIMVRINLLYKPMLPTFGFLPSSFPVQASAMMSSEAN
jgi:Flp pilus assembly protein TadG